MADIGFALLGLVITAISFIVAFAAYAYLFLQARVEPMDLIGYALFPFARYMYPEYFRLFGILYLVAPVLAITRRNVTKNRGTVISVGFALGWIMAYPILLAAANT